LKFVELSVEDLTEAVAFFEKFHSQFSECFQTKTRDVSKQSSQYIQGQLLCLERGNMTNLTKVVPDSDNQSFQQFLSDSPCKDEPVIFLLLLQPFRKFCKSNKTSKSFSSK